MSDAQQPNEAISVTIPVTETSPLLGDDVTRSETTVEISPVLEPVVETREPTSPPPTVIVTTVSGEEVGPTVDSNQTDSVDGSGSGEHQNLEDSHSSNFCSSTISCLFYLWYNSVEYISGSLLLLVFYVIILALPISAGFMGATYMDKCPVSLPTPLLVFMMGIVGTIVVFCRMGIVIAKRFMPGSTCEQTKTLVVVGNSFILLFYVTELLCFSRALASFESEDENFCNETFYSFTYYANWTFFGLILSVIAFYSAHLLRFSGCFKCTQNAST